MIPPLFRRDIASDGDNKNDKTIPIAIGLGVGIPVLLLILIIVIVTVRHRRKLREEDEKNEAINDGDDVQFETFSPKARHRVFGTSVGQSTDAESFASRPGTHGKIAGPDQALNFEDGSSTFLYTPDMESGAFNSQEGLARALHSVYGPSPSYPSTNRLRSFSKQPFAGPFDSPPRSDQRNSPRPSFGASTIPSPFHPPTDPPQRSGGWTPEHTDSVPSKTFELSEGTTRTGSDTEGRQTFDFSDPATTPSDGSKA